MNSTITAIISCLLLGCSNSNTTTRNLEASHTIFKMADMLLELPPKFWETKPNKAKLDKMFPRGIPEDFVSISTGGAQNDLEVLRLDGSSIAIAVGDGENPDYAASINARGRNLEVLHRGVNGWEDITSKVLSRAIKSNEVAKLYRDRRLVISNSSHTVATTFFYDGAAFMPQIPNKSRMDNPH